MEKFEYYIIASFEVENGAPVFLDYRCEFFRSEEEAVENCNKYNDAILSHVVLEAKTRDEFINQVKQNFKPEAFLSVLLEPSWIIENDLEAYVENGCQAYGLTREELDKITGR